MTTNEQEAARWRKAGASDVTAESVAASRQMSEAILQRSRYMLIDLAADVERRITNE